MYTTTKLKEMSTKKMFSNKKLSHLTSVIIIIFLACIVVTLSALNFSKIMEIAKGKSITPTIIYTEQPEQKPEPLSINF